MRVIVLGANGLTGRAIARDFAASGWEVVGTGRSRSRFSTELADAGVEFALSDRNDPADLAAVLEAGADVVVDCVCYTAAHATELLRHRASIGSAVVLSSKAVYVDGNGRHSNSSAPPDFDGPVREDQPVLEPDFSGDYDSREGYGRNKVAAERVLMESGVPVSILRPSRIHGTGGSRPREWFVVRRLLDGRQRIPLAHDGLTGNHPTAAVNLARLVRACADRPATRTLNAADPDRPTARDVLQAISAACEMPVETVGLSEAAPEGHGWSPWSTWPPFFLDTTASEEVGYEPVGTYADTVEGQVRRLLSQSSAERAELDANPYFAGLFDYRLDDEALGDSAG